MNRMLGTFIFILCMALAVNFTIQSWNGMVYWYPENSDQRVPAAIKKVFDFSHLEGHALEMASYKRLLKDATVKTTEDKIGIQLGHFVVKGTENKKQFACSLYEKVELIFYSADMSVSGKPSVMRVTTDCRVSSNINHIDTIWMPIKSLYQQKIQDYEIQFRENGRHVDVSLSNIGDNWPQAWSLSQIKLFSPQKPIKPLQIDHAQMQEILEKPISFLWEAKEAQ